MTMFFKKKKPAPVPVTEESGVHKEWYAEAREMTADKLPEFIERLRTGYEHDYGTICHAIAAAAIAAAWATERGPQGGITGFQAGAIMWQFIQHWMTEYQDTPARILKTEDMLYPQNQYKFSTISQHEWEFLQKRANELLVSSSSAHLDVMRHWQEIAGGQVPFGFTIKE